MMSGAHAPSAEVVRGRQRAHQARAMRARIVTLAQAYREACRQHEEISVYVLRLDVEAPDVLLADEQRTWEGMESTREALFAALGEMERLGGGGAMRCTIDLSGPDGGAFAVMARARLALIEQGRSKEEIDRILDAATRGTYQHLLDVCAREAGLRYRGRPRRGRTA